MLQTRFATKHEDIVAALRTIGDLCDELEQSPELRTPDGRIDHERTDALIGAAVDLRKAELALMLLSTGLIRLDTPAAAPSVHRGRGE